MTEPTSAVQPVREFKKYWSPLPEVGKAIARLIPAGARVLEIGPGNAPFSRATMFCGWQRPATIEPQVFVTCDIQTTPLPFADKEFDFVYCRHVLEDLYNPLFIAGEMSRVAKAGYAEIPSPLSEMMRGIDAGSPPWRGYHHHRYFVWSNNGVLNVMGKYPIIEHFDTREEEFIALLGDQPMLWNSYHLWDGELITRHWQHDIDFQVAAASYPDRIQAAISEGIDGARRFWNDVVNPQLAQSK